MHNTELSITVVKVDIKVTIPSFSQNKCKCLQCVPAALMHAEIPRPRDVTELNNDGMIKLGDVQYQIEPNLSFFLKVI